MNERMKKAAGDAAAELVKDGMVLGLGTGSTVFHFINRLAERVKEGLSIQAVSSSIRSENQAHKGNIPLANIDKIVTIDMVVDGADEITRKKEMIKGGGGSLLREKILASLSREMVVIIDESKVVDKLGECGLPVEILPFAHGAIIEKIRKLGFQGTLRHQDDKHPFITDNGNMIYDIHFKSLQEDYEKKHQQLIQIPGVLETGFFFNLAGRVVIGRSDGTIDYWD